uniref:Zinc finger protein 549 n=1 Tax=Homo sapiens TaxID=9606 RepID=M0R0L6_HUMAN
MAEAALVITPQLD